MIRLDHALLLPALAAIAALGCAGAPPQARVAATLAPTSPAVIVAAATITASPLAPAEASTSVSITPGAFPVGWVRGAPAPLDSASPDTLSLLDPQRPTVAPSALRLADLPLIEEAPRPLITQPPSNETAAPGEPAREIFITPGCGRASVRNHTFGFIAVGWVSQPIAAQSGGGVTLDHVKGGDGQHRYIPASWQTIDRAPGGALRFQETDAWFDVLSCKAYEARRLEALAQPIAGGLAYAFRTRCPSCKGTKIETLHLLTPSNGFEPDAFAHHEFALGPGQSSSKVIALSLNAITRFRQAGAVTERATDARLGVEVMQASGEAEPTAVVYVSNSAF